MSGLVFIHIYIHTPRKRTKKNVWSKLRRRTTNRTLLLLNCLGTSGTVLGAIITSGYVGTVTSHLHRLLRLAEEAAQVRPLEEHLGGVAYRIARGLRHHSHYRLETCNETTRSKFIRSAYKQKYECPWVFLPDLTCVNVSSQAIA